MTTQSPSELVRAIFRASAPDAVPDTDAGTAPDETAALPTDTAIPPSGMIEAEPVLVVEDVCALLRVGRNTIYALVAKNKIPHRRLGKRIRFSRAAVMSWLSTSWQVAKDGK